MVSIDDNETYLQFVLAIKPMLDLLHTNNKGMNILKVNHGLLDQQKQRIRVSLTGYQVWWTKTILRTMCLLLLSIEQKSMGEEQEIYHSTLLIKVDHLLNQKRG